MINNGIYIESPGQALSSTTLKTKSQGEAAPESSFSDTLSELIGDVNSLQKQSASMTESFIKGEPVDIHDVMIASEKAKTGFQLLMELRNKFTDLYKEVIRLQV